MKKTGFNLIEEGYHVFRIYGVEYKEQFGKITVFLVTAKGEKTREIFSIKDNNGEYNDRALGAFSYFSQTALNDFSIDDVDPVELVGHYILAEVKHTKVPKRDNPDEYITFVNFGDKKVATGFDEEPVKGVMELSLPNSKPPVKEIDTNELTDLLNS